MDSEQNERDKWEKCAFFETLHDCGEHRKSRKAGIYPLPDLTGNVKNHLLNLGLQMTVEGEKLTEKDLIENRAGVTLSGDDVVCAFHRYKFGNYWKSPLACQHPDHIKAKRQPSKKSRNTRPVTIEMARAISQKYRMKFPIGTTICHDHRIRETSSENPGDADAADDGDLPEPETDNPADVDFRTGSKDDLDEFVGNIISKESASPMKFQLASPVSMMAHSTKRYLNRKYRQYKEEFKKKLCEQIAPGQGSELEQLLSSDSDSDVETDDFLGTLKQEYQKCSSVKARTALLSVIPAENYSSQTVMRVFNCNAYQVKKARRMRAKCGPAGSPPEPEICHRNRLDIPKAEHFLDFLFETGALQDVAYGTTTLKYNSEEKQIVSHAVLTALRSHVIQDYEAYCCDVDFIPLSTSSLHRILKAIKPSQRRALGGIDNTTADGLESIDGLTRILEQSSLGFEDSGIVISKLEAGKRYVKMAYKMHCSNESTCATHCSSFALSNPDEKCFQASCSHAHELSCPQCNNFTEVLDDIQTKANEKGDAEVSYDVKRYISMIIEWIRHSLRGVQQDKAKRDSMKEIKDPSVALWLKDWAQKVLPASFREKQSDYFGKKGMSLAVDVFFTRQDDKLVKQVYFTTIFRCDQDSVSTMNVADHVLGQYKVDNPSIKKVFIKSDNAGCYSAASCFEAEYNICKEHGVQLLRHDFNEPQCGKDQADRESAVARKLMRAYVDAGRNIHNAEDIKAAIEYKSGVPNSKVSVIEIDKARSSVGQVKIPNSQMIHSVEFNEEGMKIWQYYEIGQGKSVMYSGVKLVPGVDVKSEFTAAGQSHHAETMGSKKRQDRSYCLLLFCPDNGCTESFDNLMDLENHMESGSHSYALVRTGMDKVRQSFAERINTSSLQHSSLAAKGHETQPVASTSASIHSPLVSVEGWAIRPKRKNTHLTRAQKSFVIKCFLTGEETGKKQTAENVVALMRSSTDQQGKKMFLPEVYLTREQVLSQFSQLAAKKRRGETIEMPEEEGYIDQEPDGETANISEEFEEADVQAARQSIKADLLNSVSSRDDNSEAEFAKYKQTDDGTSTTTDNPCTGCYVVVQCGQKFYVGMVLEVEEHLYNIKYMKLTGLSFEWLEGQNSWQEQDDIKATLAAPDMDRRGHYFFSKKDLAEINKYLHS